VGRIVALFGEGTTLVPLSEELGMIPTPRLPQTLPFTASSSFSPPRVMGHSMIFALASSVSAGVIATIFGILSLIAFLFGLYLRRGQAAKYHLIGNFKKQWEFDGVEKEYADEEPDATGDDDESTAVTSGHPLSYDYEYSYSYDYSYSQAA
jgi:hypothetical protein